MSEADDLKALADGAVGRLHRLLARIEDRDPAVAKEALFRMQQVVYAAWRAVERLGWVVGLDVPEQTSLALRALSQFGGLRVEDAAAVRDKARAGDDGDRLHAALALVKLGVHAEVGWTELGRRCDAADWPAISWALSTLQEQHVACPPAFLAALWRLARAVPPAWASDLAHGLHWAGVASRDLTPILLIALSSTDEAILEDALYRMFPLFPRFTFVDRRLRDRAAELGAGESRVAPLARGFFVATPQPPEVGAWREGRPYP